MTRQNVRITFLDAGPDSQGRRRYMLDWEDPDGIYRPEPDLKDGQPVGYRRAQCFFAVPPQEEEVST